MRRDSQESPSWAAYAGGTRVGGSLLALLGSVGLVAHLTGAAPLLPARPGLEPVASVAAFVFALLGASLCTLGSTSPSARPATRALVVGSLVIAAGRIVEIATGTDLHVPWVAGLEQWQRLTGRMGLVTSLCFVIASLALLGETRASPRRSSIDPTSMAGVLVASAGLVVSLGYMYGAPVLNRDGSPALPFPASILFVVLGLSLVIPARLRDRAARQMQDSSNRRRVEAGLIRQGVIVETISDAVVVTDLSGRVTDWNPAAERIFGYPAAAMLGREAARVLRPRHHPPLGRAIRRRLVVDGRWSGELAFVRRDGAAGIADVVVVVQRDAAGTRVAWISVSRDVTERKRTEEALQRGEEQLRRSQRLEAVGQLAGGIAHDFNNMLTAVKGYSALLLSQIDPGDPRSEDVRQIDRAADRAAALTRQLLAFSRRQLLRPRIFDLNRTVTELEQMLRRLVAEDIRLVTALEPRLRCVRADPGQIEQVIMNLVVNARDAMPHGGTLAITTANVALDAGDAARHASISAPPGAYVMLAVSDTGCGMDAATQARVFEPFFTTKEPGKGTGLGLSTAYGIVKQSGGGIWCDSEVGLGTTFRVYLPSADGTVEQPAGAEANRRVRSGSETVLLVEDDAAVRTMVRRVLLEHGYRVHEASDGAAALRLCETVGESIDLIVTDIVMPEMSGPELARRVHLRRPDMQVLYMSGYTDDAALRESFLPPGSPFIEKPFAPDALATRVRDALDAHRAAGHVTDVTECRDPTPIP